jgi:lipopolysaccharide biosynthesis protein
MKISSKLFSSPKQILERQILLKQGDRPTLAVVVHAFYEEELNFILEKLSVLTKEFDLILTGRPDLMTDFVLSRIPGKASAVVAYTYENRGRDVAPFVDLLKRGAFDGYSVVLKLHTKRSPYSNRGTSWFETLIDGLIESPNKVEAVVRAFNENRVGVCGLESQFLVDGQKFWGGNRTQVRKLRATLGVSQLPYELGFFAGTMFWFAPAAFASLKFLSTNPLKFKFAKERGQRDGTLAHSFERIFCDVSISSGYLITSMEEPSRQINFDTCLGNSIPVIQAEHGGN